MAKTMNGMYWSFNISQAVNQHKSGSK